MGAAKASNRPYVIEIESGTYNEQVSVDAPNGVIRPTSNAAVNSVIVSFATTSSAASVITITATKVRV